MIKLTYNLMRDEFATVTVLGDVLGIVDLYWILFNLPKTYIKEVTVTTLDGELIDMNKGIHNAYSWATQMSKNL